MLIRLVAILSFMSIVSGLKAQIPWHIPQSSSEQTIQFISNDLLFEGERLQNGDAIGVFYDSLGFEACAGYVIYDPDLSVIVLTAYGTDADNNSGLALGEPLTFKYWRNESACQIDSMTVEFAAENSNVFKPGDNTMVAIINGNYGEVQYAKQAFCKNEANPKPVIIGIDSITISSANSALVIDPTTGEINLSDSEPGEYTILFESETCLSSDGIVIQIQDESPLILQENLYICPASELNLSAVAGHNNYLWSNGEQSSDITIDEPGTYWVETTIGACVIRDSIVVVSPQPAFEEVSIITGEEQCDAGGTLLVENVRGQEPLRYFLISNFNQNEYSSLNGDFTDLNEGIYTLVVRDGYNCEDNLQSDNIY